MERTEKHAGRADSRRFLYHQIELIFIAAFYSLLVIFTLKIFQETHWFLPAIVGSFVGSIVFLSLAVAMQIARMSLRRGIDRVLILRRVVRIARIGSKSLSVGGWSVLVLGFALAVFGGGWHIFSVSILSAIPLLTIKPLDRLVKNISHLVN